MQIHEKLRGRRAARQTFLLAMTGAVTVASLGASAGAAHAAGFTQTGLSGACSPSVPTFAALGDAARFSEFTFGNASRGGVNGSDVEGAAAYGGTATFRNFVVGAYGPQAPALVVGKNVKGSLGLASGATGVYGGMSTAVQPGTATPTPGLAAGTVPVDFSGTKKALRDASALWGSEATTTGATVVASGDNLYLQGSNAGFNVFTLTPGQFAVARTIFVKVPVGAITLINVPDQSLPTTAYQDFQYWDGSGYETGNQYGSPAEETVQNGTLLNFPNATTLGLKSAALSATLLAPYADFSFSDGQADAPVIVQSIVGDYQSNASSFQSNLTAGFTGSCKPCDSVPTTAALGVAAGYAEFAFGAASRGKATGSDAEGAVAYGGTAKFTNFVVGAESSLAQSLVVGKNVKGTLGLASSTTGVYGGMSTAVQPGTATATPGLAAGTVPIDFDAARKMLRNESAAFGSEATSPTSTITLSGDNLYLTGTNAGLDVFTLTPGQFAAAKNIFVKVPAGATTLVNVPDLTLPTTALKAVQYWDGSAYEVGAQYGSPAEELAQASTLFNFPNTASLNLMSMNLSGTVLAPYADFVLNDGQANGTIIAQTISGDFQSNQTGPFQGACTVVYRAS